MTQENKELLLRDLCARLPYGVKCAYFDIKGEIKVGELFTVWCNEKRVFIDKLSIDYDGCDCIGVIPYLFPLSSMTDAEKEEYCQLQQRVIYNSKGPVNEDVTKYINWCYKKHLDINNLIPIGLAIDATGLDIY